MKRSVFLITAVVLLVLFVVGAEQAETAEAPPVSPGGIFLYIQGVQGGCTKAGYEGWIELKSFNYAISTSGTIEGAGRLSTDTRQLECRLAKKIDKASPVLNLYAYQQRSVREARIVIVGSDGSKVLYKMGYTLKNVIITSISMSVSDAQDPGPQETLSLSYEGVTWEYAPVSPGGDPVRTTWSLTPVR